MKGGNLMETEIISEESTPKEGFRFAEVIGYPYELLETGDVGKPYFTYQCPHCQAGIECQATHNVSGLFIPTPINGVMKCACGKFSAPTFCAVQCIAYKFDNYFKSATPFKRCWKGYDKMMSTPTLKARRLFFSKRLKVIPCFWERIHKTLKSLYSKKEG